MKWMIPLAFLISCQEAPINRTTANLFDLPPTELGETWSTKNEDQAHKILAQTQEMVQTRAASNGFMQRDAHPKAHGCVKATFSVNNNVLPPELRVGVFAKNKSYDAWIRYSNSDPDGEKKSDFEKDVRGMAVKLMNVEETPVGSQDFLMITAKEFFSKDGDDYLSLFNALKGGSARLALYGITHPLSAKRLLGARIQIAHSLETEYFSSTPYKLGPKSMRFKAKPCEAPSNDEPVKDDPFYLRKRIVEKLKKNEVCYNFFVQPNNEPKVNPIEDPRQGWNEEKSPYLNVATIKILKQEGIDSKAQLNFCENVSMDPWHTHPETRPLGQINRMRALIYQEISRLRHEGNRTMVIEPIDHTPCEGPEKVLCELSRK
ncbi:MAG: catalase [Bacteriovoracaceae bacterium]|nr:catalase [Bacteriovoracaceae bacterium]